VRARPPERHELDPIEIASRDEIAALQLARLQTTLRHVYERVPHYRTAFDRAGAHPDDLKALPDLARFPFTTKDDLRRHYPFGMFAVPRTDVVRIHASSGTTGRPTVVGYTRRDVQVWAQVCARSIRAAGGRPGDIVHVVYGYGLFTGGLGAHYGAELLGCTVVPMSGGMTERQVQLITDFRPDIIMVTPSYLLAIADEFERQGLDSRTSSDLRRGAVDRSDAPGDRAAVRPGCARHLRPLGGDRAGRGDECVETKDGLHVWEDHFYPEVIDPASGEVMADGERGELVLTTLTKEAMPVIRYRTRDLTRLLPGTARTMRRMEKITGRSDDMLIIRGVNLFPTQIEELILAAARLSPHYLFEVRRARSLDELKVVVEARPDAADAGTRAAAGAELAQHIKSRIGLTTEVAVVEPGQVERSLGKAKRIIDLRPKD
jgi:phenylacetate-CoA ligase